MEQAKVSEIFLSYQGEGPFMGSRQIFIRFFGCNLSCSYCDTSLESFKSFTNDGLLGKVLDFDDDYNELTLTGGEPLLYADFLNEFLASFKRHKTHRIYLETNGTLPKEMALLSGSVDIVAMDIKLPSSSGNNPELWDAHEAFIKAADPCELIAKAIITETTTIDDIKKMGALISNAGKEMTVVLQPVTPVNAAIERPDEEMMVYFREFLKKKTKKDVIILGQVHKLVGIR